MKKLKRLIGALGMLTMLVVVLTACGSRQSLSKQDVLTNDKASKTITWGVKADTKLFGLMDVKDGKIKGFDADIATELTKRVLGKDATANFVQVTSQTRIPLLKNGNIDAIIATMTITPEREKQVDFTNSYFDAGQSLLVKKGSAIKSVKDLNKTGTKVLGVTGANSVENIKKAAPKAKVLELSDYAQAMTALKSGQGVALTTDNGILYGMASQNPGYEVVGGAFTKEPYGIAVNKGQEPLKKALNKALKEIEADGTYNRILKKWFGNVAGFDYKEASR
ncbi:transporter substrate-binding domain-containing protein [Lactiplantibacillus paraplantarum]|uniref:Transporter substrate-binding domain-containing protein n=1 Tax=Lactiplantibacillus paraplantarum TaxID=60520 RepID=A0A370AHI0_9LACO|nr:transporter substrate-binding domain-containing protein [Lactiplantibacillus paraplantarum]OAX75507.1 glutamine ABC transporter substrate-binding protein [Lactiplantibacillus plantarum]ALO04294.1 glutamine ABC transporter substrate-binding protein [Lactiplantibacillus paraplantarum]KGE75773.1 glutamine ABC transporter substrate-binding protein [Lactiplantibacillus paraplantarum]MCT4457467.1 glutamine ABC transporter substrate-binding protein [Lactiplantibacillus paraplantarum]MCW1909521.1 t